MKQHMLSGLDKSENVVLDIACEGEDLFVGRVFKNKEDCKIKIAVYAIDVSSLNLNYHCKCTSSAIIYK